jgi:hypothetical protein
MSMDRDHELRLVGVLAIAAAVVTSTWIAAGSWKDVKRKPVRTIEVTGSAKRRITSDLIEWEASLQTEGTDRTSAYRALKEQAETTIAYLKKQGLSDAEIRPSSVVTSTIVEVEQTGSGENRVSRQVFKGYRTAQSILVSSAQVDKVERISREVTALIEQGVPVTSEAPKYVYTKLGELKIEMLAEASKDARTRAERMLKTAGDARIGDLTKADMGVINVNPANSTATSWDGNNDTTSLEKDIITIVHVTFEVGG